MEIRNMKKNFVLFFTALALILTLTACGSNNVFQQGTQRQLYVNGTGQIFLTPDVAYVYIGIQSKSEDVGDALSENNIQAQAIADTLKENGIEANDIQTSAFSVYPQQNYGMQGEMLDNTYVVDNTIYVTIRELQNLGKILDDVISAGANTINGVQFDVLDKSEALSKARALAIENAESQAQELASAAGVELGGLISLSAYSSSNPYISYEGKSIGAAISPEVPVSAGQLTIQVSADLTYEIK